MVRFRVLEISKMACLRILASTGLSERALITLDLEESVENTEAHCLVESSCVVISANVFV